MAFDTSKKSSHTAGPMSKSDVKYIVFHRTEGHVGGDLAVLTSGGGRGVGIHFYVTMKGHIYQMTPMNEGANHAGFGKSGLAAKYGNANHHAYGIELEGLESEPYPLKQLQALDEVVAYIDKYLGRKVPITTHAAIDPNRKSDPERFIWLKNYNNYRSHEKNNEVVVLSPSLTPGNPLYHKRAKMRKDCSVYADAHLTEKIADASKNGPVEVLNVNDVRTVAHIRNGQFDGYVKYNNIEYI